MKVEEALVVVEEVLAQGRLNKVQEIVFRQSWEGQSYGEIARVFGYDPGYIKDTGSKLWQLLSGALGEKVTKQNLQGVLKRSVRQRSNREITNLQVENRNKTDWGEAIDVSIFYGRTDELTTLRQWILQDRCRLVALLGMGGIGKTALSVKLAIQVEEEFDYAIWRSLLNAPPVEEILVELIEFFSDQQEIALPETVTGKISRLLHYLRQHRCLVLLDNVESILQGGTHAGQYSPGYEGYGQLFKCIEEVQHQSCLMLTSREKPREVALLEGATLPVRSLPLKGLMPAEGRQLFEDKGCFGLSDREWQEIGQHYAGNPLALKIAASSVQEVFEGNVAQLMPYLRQGKLRFEDINDLLARQFNRLSNVEQQVMYWLAINREPSSLKELEADIALETTSQQLLEALKSLGRRCLVEHSDKQWSLQPVVMEYTTSRLVAELCQELVHQKPELFRAHALIKAQSKDYIRQAQIHLILRPVIDDLLAVLGCNHGIEQQLQAILKKLQTEAPLQPGYVAGNILNLLCELKADLSYLDCSHLTIWQAYLVGVDLHEVNFANSSFAKCIFTQTFGAVLAIAFSPDGKVLATGNANGQIHLWQVEDGQHLLTCRGHSNWVRRVAFSPDGQMLASASEDRTVRIWDLKDGGCLRTMGGESLNFRSVTFSPNSQMLATTSEDQTIRLWEVKSGRCLKVLQGHNHWVLSAAFSPDGKRLASSSSDQTIRVWDLKSGQCLQVMTGHQSWVVPVSFSPDGNCIVSGSLDQTVRIWNAENGECLQVLPGHTGWVWAAAFSPDGRQIASAGVDQTIRIWQTHDGKCLHVIKEHTKQIWAVAFHPEGRRLASASEDQTIRIWDLPKGKCLSTTKGHTNWVKSVAFSPDGHQLVSGNKDQTIRIWDLQTRQCLHTLNGHTDSVISVACDRSGEKLASSSDDGTIRIWQLSDRTCLYLLKEHTSGVWSVAFSPDGRRLVSGSCDLTVKIWDLRQGRCLHTLEGHRDRIGSVAFHTQGLLVASASEDQTVKIWDTTDGKCLHTLQGHTNRVLSAVFSPDGQILASGSLDQTIKIWDIRSGKCLQTLEGHGGWILSLAFSPDGQRLVSGSCDRTVKFWDMGRYQCINTLEGHGNWVWSVAFSPNGQTLASAGEDETIRLWDAHTSECLGILRVKRPYEGLNIQGITGLTQAQKATLKVLGAVERPVNKISEAAKFKLEAVYSEELSKLQDFNN